jgi:transposase
LAVNYCGIDLAGVSSYVYVADGRGRKRWGGPVSTTREALRASLRRFFRGGLSIAIEAGNQTAWVHEVLVEMGAEVTVVNPAKVKLIAESRRKTDKVDAKILCELLRLDGLPHPVHMPCREARSLRGLLVARRQLVSARTKLCNVVRGMLRQEGIRLPARALTTFVGWERLLSGGFEQSHLLEIVAAYHSTFVSLTKSIRELERELARREKEDVRAERLQTMPRVGRITALTHLAAVDDVYRFSSSRKLVSYSGLAPTVRSSGERTNYGPITRQGRQELRFVWVQVAHQVALDRQRDTQPLRTWFRRLERRRGKKTAIVALARRLIAIAYHLLREETVYDVTRLKRRVA